MSFLEFQRNRNIANGMEALQWSRYRTVAVFSSLELREPGEPQSEQSCVLCEHRAAGIAPARPLWAQVSRREGEDQASSTSYCCLPHLLFTLNPSQCLRAASPNSLVVMGTPAEPCMAPRLRASQSQAET